MLSVVYKELEAGVQQITCWGVGSGQKGACPFAPAPCSGHVFIILYNLRQKAADSSTMEKCGLFTLSENRDSTDFYLL